MRKSQNHPFGLPAGDLENILALAAPDLETLRGKNLFITGGTGFFGKWILGGLLCANDELALGLKLVVLSRAPTDFLRTHPALAGNPVVKFVQGHIADFSQSDHRPDYIIHAAADTTAFTNEAEEGERSRSIIEGTRRILAYLRATGACRLLNISSGAVYGAAAGKRTGAGENDFEESEAITPYGYAKREAERLCAESGLDFVTARAFAFLGPYLPLDAHFAAGNFLRDALHGGPIQVRGDGTAVRSYLHPVDLVAWLLGLLLRGQSGCAYNVGSDVAVTTGQLAQLVSEAVSPQAKVVIQSLQPQGLQNIYLPNIDRAREELNLEVSISLESAIARTLDFHREP